jgi:hypothetical protein
VPDADPVGPHGEEDIRRMSARLAATLVALALLPHSAAAQNTVEQVTSHGTRAGTEAKLHRPAATEIRPPAR